MCTAHMYCPYVPPRYDYDLAAWRQGSAIPKREFELLDAADGAGWALLGTMLRERAIETDDEGVVTFTDKGVPRVSASEALRHRCASAACVPHGAWRQLVPSRPWQLVPSRH
jgi:hypothetical protein